jgi:hypothetical protein
MTVFLNIARNYSSFPFATGVMCISFQSFIKLLKTLIPPPNFVPVSNYYLLLPAPGVRVSLRHSNCLAATPISSSIVRAVLLWNALPAVIWNSPYIFFFQKSVKKSLPLVSVITIVYDVVLYVSLFMCLYLYIGI